MEKYTYQQVRKTPHTSSLIRMGLALAIAYGLYNAGEKYGLKKGLALGEPREAKFLSMQYSHDFWSAEDITGVEIRTGNKKFIFLKDKNWCLFPATKEINILNGFYVERSELCKKIRRFEEILHNKKHSLGEKR